MKLALNYAFVLIWLAYLIVSGVFLFSRGYLLSRVSKLDRSKCHRIYQSNNNEFHISENTLNELLDVPTSPELCLPRKSKIIILLVDALKYEFGLCNTSVIEPLPYQNKLCFMNELLTLMPEHTRLLKFKADPPTATLQRLKGLTTGSLPTFIDIGSNFATPEINEDNIIDQMVNNNISVVFLGDSTWTDLYPRQFLRSYAYPSFNIFDLDTVDNNIIKHMSNEMQKTDWQVLIGHFLGVDHCGHKHGPMHKEMARKLTEMNDMIRHVVREMDNETILFVMGDHGMTATGDHGGDTDDETISLLFAHSKQMKFLTDQYGSDSNLLQQIDIVPTLATILGIPIPYSNLGLINFNIIPNITIPHLSKFQTVLLHAWQNAKQIYTYFNNYALENKRTFNVEQMSELETNFILLTHRVKTIYNEAAFRSFIEDLNKYLRDILNTCRHMWVRFDPVQMSQGLLATFLPIFLMFLLTNNARPMDFYRIFTPKEVGYTYLLNFAAAVFGYRYYKYFSFKTEEHSIIFFTNGISTLILVFHIIQNWNIIMNNYSKAKKFNNMFVRLLLMIMFSVYFSNSFILHEGKILSYLFIALIILMFYELLEKSMAEKMKGKFRFKKFLKSTAFTILIACLLCVILIRFANTLFRCREEQGDCIDFINSEFNSNINNSKMGNTKYKWPYNHNSTYMLSVITIVLYTALTRLYLKSCGNLTGTSCNILIARYGPTIASICASGHILLQNSPIKTIQRTHIDILALIIYALLVLQIVVVSFAPLMVYVLPRNQSVIITQHNLNDNIVPELFKKLKHSYERNYDNTDAVERRNDHIPVVYGLATIYSSIIISFSIFLAMVLIILLGPRAAIGLIISLAIAYMLLYVHAIIRFRTASNFESCIQPTFTMIIAWFMLTHLCFFITSHQTTLSQIDWRAAFVGRTIGLDQSNFISGLLIILNTFCGAILFSCTFSLLSTQTFSIFALFPHFVKINREQRRVESFMQRVYNQNIPLAEHSLSEISNDYIGFDITRGELILFEQEYVFFGALFKLACQIYMLQGLKVFCSMLACTIHCRHLMVWKIFAPRFIYEALTTFVILPSIIIGYLIIVRIHKAIDMLIIQINENKNNKIKTKEL